VSRILHAVIDQHKNLGLYSVSLVNIFYSGYSKIGGESLPGFFDSCCF
jgi:hypothetical protein